MAGKHWYRVGVGLFAFGLVVFIIGLFVGYRHVVGLPVPAFLDGMVREAATNSFRLRGAIILGGPGLLIGLLGYALMEKYGDHQWD